MKMKKIKGVVEAVSQKDDRYGVKLRETGEWYNGFGNCSCERGDEVTIDFEEIQKNGMTFRNVKEIKKSERQKPDEKGNVHERMEQKVDGMRKASIEDAADLLVECQEALTNRLGRDLRPEEIPLVSTLYIGLRRDTDTR